MRSKDWIASVALAYSLGIFVGVAGIRIANAKAQESNNVNARYTVESVELTGIDEGRLSRRLRNEIRRRIGEKFHPDVFAELAVKIKQELRARAVSPQLARGTNAENVKVLLAVEPGKSPFDPSRSRLAYHASQGLSGAAFVNLETPGNAYRAGYLNIGEETVDRVEGVSLAYQRKFFRDRFRAGFQFDALNSKWDSTTQLMLASNGQYRDRESYMPTLTYSPIDGVSLTTGFQFTNYNFARASQVANLGGGSSQSLVSTLRLHRDWGEPDSVRQEASAEYGARIGTQIAGGDYSFRRHYTEARYRITANNQRIETRFTMGRLDGNAPLNERFVAGNSRLLRGWNKLDLTPVGATRVVAGSVEYAWRASQKWMPTVFADSGTVWSHAIARVVRNSAGGGFRTRDGFYLLVAFPFKEGRVEPQVMTGVNF